MIDDALQRSQTTRMVVNKVDVMLKSHIIVLITSYLSVGIGEETRTPLTQWPNPNMVARIHALGNLCDCAPVLMAQRALANSSTTGGITVYSEMQWVQCL